MDDWAGRGAGVLTFLYPPFTADHMHLPSRSFSVGFSGSPVTSRCVVDRVAWFWRQEGWEGPQRERRQVTLRKVFTRNSASNKLCWTILSVNGDVYPRPVLTTADNDVIRVSPSSRVSNLYLYLSAYWMSVWDIEILTVCVTLLPEMCKIRFSRNVTSAM